MNRPAQTLLAAPAIGERSAQENPTDQDPQRPPKKSSGSPAASIRALLIALSLSVVTPSSVLAVSAVWLLNPGSGDWNPGTNWSTSPVAPVTAGDTATFNISTVTSLTLSGSVTIGSITFQPGASAFTINTNGQNLAVEGIGIVNNSGKAQAITNNGAAFQAGITGITIVAAGSTQFLNASTAGSATITNYGGAFSGGSGGSTQFLNASTAASATITNYGGDVFGARSGLTEFLGTSTAGNATITNNGGASGAEGGSTFFFDRSDGGTARAITNGNGSFDISGLTTAGMGIGSIEGSGNYFLGSKMLSVGGNNLSTTVSGVIQDGGASGGTGGSLTKVGTGTLTLTGTNTYSGGTTISAGTLQLGNGGTTGSIAGNVTDNAILAFSRSDAFTFGGVISGTGSVQQIGTGTAVLTANNTYTGGTTISAGTLQLGAGGTTGSIVANVTDNAALIFDHSNAITFPGVISGTGSVTQAGTGTLILTGDNTYTGGTTIAAGSTLQLGVG
ncbi:MAG: autotransporter-associated beta strand repeat-containing protein, partial [Verrucomicrobia bacterium]|nr:autotransporter-associated beta strand repeat-containing protein [Verrucomicrobiota bacterium]